MNTPLHSINKDFFLLRRGSRNQLLMIGSTFSYMCVFFAVAFHAPVIVSVLLIASAVLLEYLTVCSAFRRLRVVSDGLAYSRWYYPTPITKIPWNTIQKVSSQSCDITIVGKTCSDLLTFNFDTARVDQLINILRARVPIEVQEPLQVGVLFPSTTSSASEKQRLVTPAEQRIPSFRNWFIFGIILYVLLLFVASIGYAACTKIDSTPPAITAIIMFPGVVAILCGVPFLEFLITDYVIMRVDDVNFRAGFCSRRSVPWSDILYARVVPVKRGKGGRIYHHLRIFIRGMDDYIADMGSPESSTPMAEQLVARHIPILSQLEPFQGAHSHYGLDAC